MATKQNFSEWIECDNCGEEVDEHNFVQTDGADFCAACGEGDERLRAYRAWLAEVDLLHLVGADGDDLVPVEPEGRFLLFENSRFGQRWITFHDAPQPAAQAHINQEYASDWQEYLPELVDLDNPDDVYDLRVEATFVKRSK